MNAVFLLSRVKRAIQRRLDLRIALRCARQRNRKVVKFIGIANIPGRVAFYPSLQHFRHDIPAVLPRRHYDILVAQNFMHDEFMNESRPKVFFSREPMACLTEQTRRNLARADSARFIISFDEEDINRRMFYVALPGNKARLIRKLAGSRDRKRPGFCCIVNRYAANDHLPLLEQRMKFVRAMGGDIDIYGHAPSHAESGWAAFPNYRGPTRNKLRTLARYDFNLCFENSDSDGYITEKIIHALMAGCVPLYWGGGRFLGQTIPAQCFINCKGQHPADVYQHIRAMPQDEIVGFRQAGLDFISSREADRFSWDYWSQSVTQRLLNAP